MLPGVAVVELMRYLLGDSQRIIGDEGLRALMHAGCRKGSDVHLLGGQAKAALSAAVVAEVEAYVAHHDVYYSGPHFGDFTVRPEGSFLNGATCCGCNCSGAPYSGGEMSAKHAHPCGQECCGWAEAAHWSCCGEWTSGSTNCRAHLRCLPCA